MAVVRVVAHHIASLIFILSALCVSDGQTGSGKTFTMFGPSNAVSDMRGVIPRCAEELFSGLDAIDEVEEVTIKCSFLEIYKEVIQGRSTHHPASLSRHALREHTQSAFRSHTLWLLAVLFFARSAQPQECQPAHP